MSEVTEAISELVVEVPKAMDFYKKYSKALSIKNLHPKDDIVIAKVIDEEVERESGIIIPRGVEAPVVGIVIAVGPGKITKNGERIPMEVNIGDKILFSKHANLDMSVHGEQLKIVREGSIVGIVE